MGFRVEVSKSQEFRAGALVPVSGGRVALVDGDETVFCYNGTGHVEAGSVSIPLEVVKLFVNCAEAETDGSAPAPKRRGRPPKVAVPAKRRGRPAKVKAAEDEEEAPVVKRRGRPAKVKEADEEPVKSRKVKAEKKAKVRIKIKDVIAFVAKSSEPVTPAEVAEKFGIPPVNAANHLKRATDAGLLKKVERGQYVASKKVKRTVEEEAPPPKKVKKVEADDDEEPPPKKAKKEEDDEGEEAPPKKKVVEEDEEEENVALDDEDDEEDEKEEDEDDDEEE